MNIERKNIGTRIREWDSNRFVGLLFTEKSLTNKNRENYFLTMYRLRVVRVRFENGLAYFFFGIR